MGGDARGIRTGVAVRSQSLGPARAKRGGVPAMERFGELTHRWPRLPPARLSDELARTLADGLDGVAGGCLQRRQGNVHGMFHVGRLLAYQGGGDVEAYQGTVTVPVRLLDG